MLPPNVEHRAKNPEGFFESLISPSNPGGPVPGAGHDLDQGAVLDVLAEDELMNDWKAELTIVYPASASTWAG